ncbi:hypothetical protein F5880DRAFT_1510086 [Lentinula raphanica]|nr:hypothetical protein F5880DRAFT_1510086 [Lentinula raphanica]
MGDEPYAEAQFILVISVNSAAVPGCTTFLPYTVAVARHRAADTPPTVVGHWDALNSISIYTVLQRNTLRPAILLLFIASCLLRVAVAAAPTGQNLAQAAASTRDELPESLEEETGHASGFATTLNNWPTIGGPRKLDPQMDEIVGCWRHIDWVMYFMFTQPSGTSKLKSKHVIAEPALKVWKEMKTKKFRELLGFRLPPLGMMMKMQRATNLPLDLLMLSSIPITDIFLYEFFDKKGRVTGTVMLAIGPKSELFCWKTDLQVYRDKGWSKPQTTLIGQAKFPNPHTRDAVLNNARNAAAEAVKERIRRIPVNQAPGVGVPKYMDFWDTFVSKLAEHIDSATRDKFRRVRSKRVHELEAYKSKELTRKRTDRARNKGSL